MKSILTKEGKNEVISRLDKLTPDTQRKWGTMNVNQMLAHMNDAIRISLGMKPAVNTSSFYNRYIMLPAAIYILPFWPKGEATAPELNQQDKGSRARDFYTEMEFTKKMLDIFEEREASKFHPHPMFGALSKEQWARLLYKHFQHHLRQFGV